MRYLILAIFCFVILFQKPAVAQDTQLAAFTKIMNLEGSWEIKASAMDADGNWKSGIASLSEFKPILDRSMIEEKATFYFPGFNIYQKTTFSYDQFRNTFRMSVCDATSGLMDIYEGHYDGKTKSLTVNNLKSGTFFRNIDGEYWAFKLVYHLKNENEILLEIKVSVDREAKWQDYMKVNYKRLKK